MAQFAVTIMECTTGCLNNRIFGSVSCNHLNVTKTHLAPSSLSLAPHWSVSHWTWGPDQTSASHWTWVPGLTWVPDWTSVLHWLQVQPQWSMAAHLQQLIQQLRQLYLSDLEAQKLTDFHHLWKKVKVNFILSLKIL